LLLVWPLAMHPACYRVPLPWEELSARRAAMNNELISCWYGVHTVTWLSYRGNSSTRKVWNHQEWSPPTTSEATLAHAGNHLALPSIYKYVRPPAFFILWPQPEPSTTYLSITHTPSWFIRCILLSSGSG